MRRHGARRALATVAAVLLLLGVAACGAPQPSATADIATVAPSPTLTASPTVTAPAVAAEPRVECAQDDAVWTTTDANGSQVPVVLTLTCENAVAAAKAVVGPDQGIAYIEFGRGFWCPPGASCPIALPDTGHVIFHTKGLRPDLLVSVRADEAGKVTASDPRPLSSPSG